MENNHLARPGRDEGRPHRPAANALADDTVAVILAGGEGTRLEPLTRKICKPALPFGAGYRSIDFSLSNCVNSGIGRIGVATQHKPQALLAHLERVWGDVVTDPQHFIAPWRAETRGWTWSCAAMTRTAIGAWRSRLKTRWARRRDPRPRSRKRARRPCRIFTRRVATPRATFFTRRTNEKRGRTHEVFYP